MLYRTYVESAFTYGAPILNIISVANLRRLQTLQNTALRICYDAPSYTRTQHLHQLARLPMVADRLRALGVGWLAKAETKKIHNFHIPPPPPPAKTRRACLLPVLNLLWKVLTERRNVKKGSVLSVPGVSTL